MKFVKKLIVSFIFSVSLPLSSARLAGLLEIAGDWNLLSIRKQKVLFFFFKRSKNFAIN